VPELHGSHSVTVAGDPSEIDHRLNPMITARIAILGFMSREAGVVGAGGAGFPTYVKAQSQVEYMIANGAECEPGAVVTREEFYRVLWGTENFVGFDKSLNAAVGKLRQSLLDTADNPRFIETVPRQGYRFVCPVTWANAPQTSANPPAESVSVPPQNSTDVASLPSRRGATLRWLILLSALIPLAIYAVCRSVGDRERTGWQNR
jgi:DNA-binding winged helix-turn-helix (wHTH) protein